MAPGRSVDELVNDALSFLGKTPVIKTEDLDRSRGVDSVTDRFNPTIEPEPKDLLANRMKRRHELRSIILPPTTLPLRPILTRPLPREACHQIPIVQVGSGTILPTPILRLDVLHMR